VPTIERPLVILVTNWLQLAFHDFRPAMDVSHAPSLGLLVLMMSADIFS
jgi:hypothetical protein